MSECYYCAVMECYYCDWNEVCETKKCCYCEWYGGCYFFTDYNDDGVENEVMGLPVSFDWV